MVWCNLKRNFKDEKNTELDYWLKRTHLCYDFCHHTMSAFNLVSKSVEWVTLMHVRCRYTHSMSFLLLFDGKKERERYKEIEKKEQRYN